MFKKSFVHYLTKIVVDIMFYGGIIICVTLPLILPPLLKMFGYAAYRNRPFTVVLLPAGICAVFILWQLKAFFKTLLGGNPFIMENITCFRKMAVASLLLAIIFLFAIFYINSFVSLVFVVMFAILGLVCLTLKDVFKQAIAYKEENDWTV